MPSQSTRARIQHACQMCGKGYFTFPSRIAAGNGKFCSRRCSGRAQPPQRTTHPGDRFGLLVVLHEDMNRQGVRRRWICQCDCGGMRTVDGTALRLGQITSCGCLAKASRAARDRIRMTTHGLSTTPEYGVWQAMRQRCTNPKTAGYKNYGGRGIVICSEWMDFLTFLADMGPRPSPSHSIERNDVNGPYADWNCRWATQGEQMKNTRVNVRLTHNGRTMIVAEWARDLGIRTDIIFARLKLGWSVERTLTEPVASRRKGYPGVHWDAARGKWVALLRNNGKTIHLGRFKNEETAIEVVEAARFSLTR